MERDFKGIWIPKNIWLDTGLSLQEKAFLVEIDSLDNHNGCYASNDYFSEFFNLSKNRCSEVIKKLEKKGYLSTSYIRSPDKKNIEKRIIRLLENTNTPIRKIDRPIREVDRGYSEKGEENNTLVNNTINNKDIYIPFKEVIEYLNEKVGTHYRSSTSSTKDKIKARWNEEFKIEDFKRVIDNKVADWKGKFNKDGVPMDNYLRPETLFGTKFESYLNQKKEEYHANGVSGTGQNTKTSENKFSGFKPQAPKHRREQSGCPEPI